MPRKSKEPLDLGFLQSMAGKARPSGVFEAATAESAQVIAQARHVEIERLGDNPFQPRLSVEEAGLGELAQVIRQQGFQGVLVARPNPDQEGQFQITAGHRRRDAARLAGLATLPVLVKDLSNEEMAAIAITENIQREDLTALEEGRIFQLMVEEMGFTHEQVAKEVGKNRGYVENRLRVVRAPDDVQELVRQKPDTLRSVVTLVKVSNEKQRADAIKMLLAGKLTADDLPVYLEKHLPKPKQASKPKTVEKPLPDIRQSKSKPAAEEDYVLTEREVARVANARLTGALRTFADYYNGLVEQPRELSKAEYRTLEKVFDVLEALRELIGGK